MVKFLMIENGILAHCSLFCPLCLVTNAIYRLEYSFGVWDYPHNVKYRIEKWETDCQVSIHIRSDIVV